MEKCEDRMELLEQVFKSKIEVCNYKLDNVKANLNTVRDDIESSQQLLTVPKLKWNVNY